MQKERINSGRVPLKRKKFAKSEIIFENKPQIYVRAHIT